MIAKRIANVLCVAGLPALLLALLAGWTDVAKADPVPAQASDPYVARIVPLNGDAIRVTMSDGYKVRLKPCVYEDGRRCYWVADRMGNGRGNSFLVVRGKVYRMNLTGL